MKTILVRFFEHPEKTKQKLTLLDILNIAERVYPEKIDTIIHHFSMKNADEIAKVMAHGLEYDECDSLCIIDSIECNVFEMMKTALDQTCEQSQVNKITLLEIENARVKSLNQTLGIYENEMHYTNLLPLKSAVVNDYLTVIC